MNMIGVVLLIYANWALSSLALSPSDMGKAGNDCGMAVQTGFGAAVATSRLSLDKCIGSSTFSRLYLMMLATATLYSPLRMICLFSLVVKLAALLFENEPRLASL